MTGMGLSQMASMVRLNRLGWCAGGRRAVTAAQGCVLFTARGAFLCTCQASGCESVGSCWLSVTAFAAGPGARKNLLADHGDHC
jgi:hypothetical protein